MSNEQKIARIERLEELVAICLRDLKYATNPKSLKHSTEDKLRERGQQALTEMAKYSAELTHLSLTTEV